ncbi:MAG: translocation/assembly module TamB domain-containing protein [Acetobacteraceae bacterium]
MPRWAKRIGIGAASLLGAAVLVLLIVLLGANTGPGRALVSRLVPELTAGQVHIAGLTGDLPGALRVQYLSLADSSGRYLTAENVALEWQPLRLFSGTIVVDRLTAAEVQWHRLPSEQKVNRSHAQARPAKPMPLVVRQLAVSDLTIAPALAGRQIALALSASGSRGADGVDTLDLDARPLERGGHYRIKATLTPDKLALNADFDEPEAGLLAGFAGLALAGPIRIEAHLNGPRSAIAATLDASLGRAGARGTAHASGRIDLAALSADLRITASTGAMEPRPGIGWRSAALHGTLDGPFAKPRLSGVLEATDVTAAGTTVANVTAKLSGGAGQAQLQAQLAGIRLPGPIPQLLAGAPLELDATARLDAPGRPITFVVRHPLIGVRGDAGNRQLSATITLPDLHAMAALIHRKLAGSAAITLKANELPQGFAISSTARLALSEAPAPALALLGSNPTLALAAEVHNGTASLSRASVIGAGFSLDAQGKISRKTAALQWQAKLPEINRVGHGVEGSLAAHGTIDGPIGAATLTAEVHGTLAAAPLGLALTGTEAPLHVTIESASWKSAHATGTITPDQGQIRFRIANLADLSSLVGPALAGSAEGTLSAKTGSAGPQIKGALRLQNVRYGNLMGSARLTAEGPLDALALRIKADTEAPAPASLNADVVINGPAGEASLSALALRYRGLSARQIAPARLVFSPQLAVHGLKLAAAGAELDADGSLSPRLALNLSLRNATPGLISPFLPHLAIKGRLDAQAKLTGSLGAPAGSIEAHASGLGFNSGLAAGLPPADLALDATIAGQQVRLKADLAAGRGTRVRLSGTAPLGSAGTLDFGVNGRVDLALLQPAMAANGRHLEGALTLDARVGGTYAAPQIAGSAVVSGGSFADYQTGLALSQIHGRFEIADGRIEIGGITADAGPGTIRLAGSIGLLQQGIPLSLVLSARDAEPLQSDRIRLWLDSDLRLTGFAQRQLSIGGTLHVRRAEIAIPKSLPPNIAVLKVVRPGAKPAPPPTAPPPIALDVTLDAPRQIFVRGRGVDAEFGGRIHLSGTAAAPQAVGSFHLVRGAVSLAGQTLNFTSGTIGFNGGDPTDPTLALVATASTRATTATLTLGGTVRKPTVTLSSVPELPQDQVLAALLFGTASSSLSPFQIAEMANALTSLTGSGPSIGNPLGAIRKTLGLDQLSIGSDAAGNAALQAGRYIAPGVYVGASQSSSGGSQARVKIDLTKRLKLEATTGNGGGSATAIGGGSTPDTSNGSSIGLTYQFQY